MKLCVSFYQWCHVFSFSPAAFVFLGGITPNKNLVCAALPKNHVPCSATEPGRTMSQVLNLVDFIFLHTSGSSAQQNYTMVVQLCDAHTHIRSTSSDHGHVVMTGHQHRNLQRWLCLYKPLKRTAVYDTTVKQGNMSLIFLWVHAPTFAPWSWFCRP